ncbi:hypothetical protein ACFL2R_03130 [Patescibacteria group bacterium]
MKKAYGKAGEEVKVTGRYECDGGCVNKLLKKGEKFPACRHGKNVDWFIRPVSSGI